MRRSSCSNTSPLSQSDHVFNLTYNYLLVTCGS